MKRLLKRIARRLGLLKTNDNKEQAFFSYQRNDSTITCRWNLEEKTQKRLQQEADELSLLLRLRQLDHVQTHHGISIAAIQAVGINRNVASIPLPTFSGMLLLELGYKQRDGSFVTLHFHPIDLGEADAPTPASDDWFPMPQPQSMHQVMYDLATKSAPIGGSERLSS